MSGTYAYTVSDKLTCEYMSGIIPVILGAVPTVLLKYMMRVLNFATLEKSLHMAVAQIHISYNHIAEKSH